MWRMICDPDSSVREALFEVFRKTRCDLNQADFEELEPLLRHENGDVRISAMKLFRESPYHFDEKLCLKIANSAVRENLDIQTTIGEFLEGLGQVHLVVSEQGENASS